MYWVISLIDTCLLINIHFPVCISKKSCSAASTASSIQQEAELQQKDFEVKRLQISAAVFLAYFEELSNEENIRKWLLGCLLYVGMKNYPVVWGLFYKPWHKDLYEPTRIQ